MRPSNKISQKKKRKKSCPVLLSGWHLRWPAVWIVFPHDGVCQSLSNSPVASLTLKRNFLRHLIQNPILINPGSMWTSASHESRWTCISRKEHSRSVSWEAARLKKKTPGVWEHAGHLYVLLGKSLELYVSFTYEKWKLCHITNETFSMKCHRLLVF